MLPAPRVFAVVVMLCAAAPWPVASARPALRVGTSGDYAPFSKAGRGFDVDVARAMSAALGYRVAWRSFSWPELEAAVRRGDFDIAMSGVTWRPGRAVYGTMSRAVASGGPCLLGMRPAGRVGVNRGGILEAYAADRFGRDRLVTLDDNAGLPGLLASGEVGAIVTDSFELAHFARAGWISRCEPPLDRKVYWITPAAPQGLAERVDAWIANNEPLLRRLRKQWFGAEAPRSDVDHLVDLLARRLAVMPAVAADKRAHGRPIEDLARERVVLRKTAERARSAGIAGSEVEALFRLQIELAKAVQRRAPAKPPSIPLSDLRRLLLAVGDRTLTHLARAGSWPAVTDADLQPLGELLEPGEVRRLRDALGAVQEALRARMDPGRR